MKKFIEHPVISGVIAGLVVYWVPIVINLFSMSAQVVMTLYILGGIVAAYFFYWLISIYNKQREEDRASLEKKINELTSVINKLTNRAEPLLKEWEAKHAPQQN